MLGLSGAIILLSLGASLLLAFGYVSQIALCTPSNIPFCSRIIILSMRLHRNGDLGACYHARHERALALSRQSEQSRIVILGGVSASGTRSEAKAGAACLVEMDIHGVAIETEDRSRHTLENLLVYRERYPLKEAEMPVLDYQPLAHGALFIAGDRSWDRTSALCCRGEPNGRIEVSASHAVRSATDPLV